MSNNETIFSYEQEQYNKRLDERIVERKKAESNIFETTKRKIERRIDVKFEFDNFKTVTVRHKRTGKILRQHREATGETSTCSTSIPESAKNNAIDFINTDDGYKQFRGTNPRNLIITNS